MEYEKLFNTGPNDHLNFDDGTLRISHEDRDRSVWKWALTEKETKELFEAMKEYFMPKRDCSFWHKTGASVDGHCHICGEPLNPNF